MDAHEAIVTVLQGLKALASDRGQASVTLNSDGQCVLHVLGTVSGFAGQTSVESLANTLETAYLKQEADAAGIPDMSDVP